MKWLIANSQDKSNCLFKMGYISKPNLKKVSLLLYSFFPPRSAADISAGCDIGRENTPVRYAGYVEGAARCTTEVP